MKTTKAYLAGLGLTGIVIGSVLLLLVVGTGFVAFDGAPVLDDAREHLERVVVEDDALAAPESESARDEPAGRGGGVPSLPGRGGGGSDPGRGGGGGLPGGVVPAPIVVGGGVKDSAGGVVDGATGTVGGALDGAVPGAGGALDRVVPGAGGALDRVAPSGPLP